MNQGALCSTFQEIREVGVDDVRVTPEQQLLHVYDCLLGISPGTIGVDFRWKIGFFRGRDAHYWAPPAQIHTSGFPACGSYLGWLTAKRRSGHG